MPKRLRIWPNSSPRNALKKSERATARVTVSRSVALTDHLLGGSISVRVKPGRLQLAVSKPAHPLRSAAQAAALRSALRATGPDLRLVHVS